MHSEEEKKFVGSLEKIIFAIFLLPWEHEFNKHVHILNSMIIK